MFMGIWRFELVQKASEARERAGARGGTGDGKRGGGLDLIRPPIILIFVLNPLQEAAESRRNWNFLPLLSVVGNISGRQLSHPSLIVTWDIMGSLQLEELHCRQDTSSNPYAAGSQHTGHHPAVIFYHQPSSRQTR